MAAVIATTNIILIPTTACRMPEYLLKWAKNSSFTHLMPEESEFGFICLHAKPQAAS